MASVLKRLIRTFYAWRRRRTERWFRQGTKVRGRYTIVKQIGEGSFGLVYLCRDRLHEDRLCVLKRVQPLSGGVHRTIGAYRMETSILTRMRCVSIPQLYERFSYRGFYCFTMEYAPGVSLEKMLYEDHHVFTESESLALAGKLLNILEYVHAQGVVHRDIRIANVIVDNDSLHLIDFGQARLLHEPSALLDETEEDVTPEKKLRSRIDVTSDFYALGHLLILLLYRTRKQNWEEGLETLHPNTKRLIRRLLQADQPYTNVLDVQTDVRLAIQCLQLEATS